MVAAAAPAGTVVEQPLAAALGPVYNRITYRRVVEGAVMGRHIAVRSNGDGIYQGIVAIQQRFLDCRQHLVGIAIETGAIAYRVGSRLRLVVPIEEIIDRQPAGRQICLEALTDRIRPLAGQIEDT